MSSEDVRVQRAKRAADDVKRHVEGAACELIPCKREGMLWRSLSRSLAQPPAEDVD